MGLLHVLFDRSKWRSIEMANNKNLNSNADESPYSKSEIDTMFAQSDEKVDTTVVLCRKIIDILNELPIKSVSDEANSVKED